jgi:hypothetical protein
MHMMFVTTPPALLRDLVRVICSVGLLLTASAQAADRWTNVSISLLERLTNGGSKLGYPGGCSGVVANRLSGDVTIKVVGCGLWRSSDQGKSWRRIDTTR